MAWRFRKSKTFGPLRLVLSKRGVGASIGFGPLRYSIGADGKVRRTTRLPGGMYNTETIGDLSKSDDEETNQ